MHSGLAVMPCTQLLLLTAKMTPQQVLARLQVLLSSHAYNRCCRELDCIFDSPVPAFARAAAANL